MWEEEVRIYDTPGVPNNFPNLEKCYTQNIITTNSKWQLLQAVIGRQKSNFCGKFKLEPITTY